MSLGAFVWQRQHAHGRGDDHRTDPGAAWASVIAVLFAAVAAISFALDQSITLSGHLPPATHSSSR